MSNERGSEPPVEWEGGDPPCWAHLFENDEPAAAPGDAAVTRGESGDHSAESGAASGRPE